MSEIHPTLLVASLEYIGSRSDEFAEEFYARLWVKDERTKQLFANTDMRTQRIHLMQTLTIVTNALLRGDVGITTTIEALGRRHHGYKVLPEYYDLVGETLIETLVHFMGATWTPAIQTSWANAFTLIKKVMLSSYGDALDK
jgi:hemoglobin-like flavoprotein